MATIRLKYAVPELRGMLCEVNLRRSHEQETIVNKQPPIRRASLEPSEAQAAHRQRFKLAIAYAKAALADPEVQARYKQMAQQQGKRPWGVAVADYLAGNDLLVKN